MGNSELKKDHNRERVMELYKLSFDQYQRYKTTQLIIEKLRRGKKLRILEVGANTHFNLEKFRPKDEIMYLDIELPEKLKNNPKCILGDATNLEFEDNSYDVIIALDVYEHIPLELREAFLSELCRVGKNVVISAPFDFDKVAISEKRMNNYYKRYNKNKGFRWLEEHIENGLPNLEESLNFLKTNTSKFIQTIPHGNLNLWKLMYKIHFQNASSNNNFKFLREEADELYNKFLYQNDIGNTADCYRNFIVVSSEKQRFDFFNKKNIDNNFYIEMLESILVDISKDKDLDGEKIIINQIFYGNDNGFQEENSDKTERTIGKNYFKIPKGVKQLRFDPSENAGILTLKDSNITIKNTNASLEIGNKYIFLTEDPQIYVNYKNEKEFIISYDYKKLSMEDLSKIMLKLKSENDELKGMVVGLEGKDKDLKEEVLSLEEINRLLEEELLSIKNTK